MKWWQKFILLIIISAIVHELGHVIAGGGFQRIRYAPDYDLLSAMVYVEHNTIFTMAAGFLFTLPLLYFSRLLIFVLFFQSRYDFMNIYYCLEAGHF